MAIKNYRNILFILTILVFIDKNLSIQINEIENDLKVIDELSRISQIKSISNEIKGKANRKTDSCQSQNKTKSVGKSMKINNNLLIKGNITSGNVLAEQIKIIDNLYVKRTFSSNEIMTNMVASQTIILNELKSPTGVITIRGDVIINNDIFSDTNINAKSFVVQGVKQWSLTHHEDFESDLNGWTDKRTNRCHENGNIFLGGHCNFSFDQVSKTFTNLPPHTHLRLNSLFHMFDSWDGETAFAKIDGNIIWTKIGKSSSKSGVNICGGDSNDAAFALPVDSVVPHTNSSVTITFGSTLKSDPCDASFGIDDVMIYVK